MALGKAFIEVHADTAPFARELGKEINRILREQESKTTTSGSRIGSNIAKGVSQGITRNRKSIGNSLSKGLQSGVQQSQGLFSRLGAGLVDTIDDGLSGLPAELKAVLGGALLAVAPIAGSLIAAAITGAIATALTFGVAGLGILAASQFSEIGDQFTTIFTNLRSTIVEDAQVIFPVLTAGLEMVEKRLLGLRPVWQKVFQAASTVILPLLDGILGFAENFGQQFAASFDNLDEFADLLGRGLREIGTAAGQVIRAIANDDDAVAALTDLLLLVRDLILFTGMLVKAFLDLYGALRAIAIATDGLGIIQTDLKDFNRESLLGAQASAAMSAGISGTVQQLESEQKALDEANKVLDDYIKRTFGSWDANIQFEQSLDDMAETLAKHRGALDLNSQAGRDNQKVIRDASAALIEQRNKTIELTGNTEHANQVFATNRKRLEDQAAAAGINRQRFRDLTDAILDVPPPKETGVTQSSVNRAQALRQALSRIGSTINQLGKLGAQHSSGFQMYAEGGIVNRPTMGLVGEAGPEAILPLNNPGRASQILSQTGLGSSLSPTVNVYIGNQAIDAYIDTRVAGRMATTARDLAYGSRGI